MRRDCRSLPTACVQLARMALAGSRLADHGDAVRELAQHLHEVILTWVTQRLMRR
jgi:hypothetical protein